VAAGQGIRFGGRINKQFVKIHGMPILFHTLQKFEKSSVIDEIVIVVPNDFVESVRTELNQKWCLQKVIEVVSGGNERYDSVYNGLRATNEKADIIVIHDGVRPCISTDLIERSVKACREYSAVIVGVQPKDTIKEKSGIFVRKTFNRTQLVSAQTPQVFKRDLIFKAYEQAIKEGQDCTDDATLVENLGHPVAIIEGAYSNIKITSKEDLMLAETILRE